MTASKRKAIGRNKVNALIPLPLSNHESSSSSSSSEENMLGGTGVNLTISKKTNKPLMEKRRRARINESLALLKDLILVETDNPSKLEKADILELTVKRVRAFCDLQARTQDAFQEGFEKCLGAATGFLDNSGLADLSHRLTSHIRSGGNPTLDELRRSPLGFPTPPMESLPHPQDLLNEPINLTLLPTNGRGHCGVWRPW